jgi:2-keto-4-pentenoate hydratase/2-oxohepta-3-ene-1,7-dioic acid hydratase in catechol pathway
MLLYRIGPEGFFAAAEEPGGPLHVLFSDPFETRPGGWELGRAVDPSSAALLAPVAPGKIVGIGRNYREHARELDNPMPAEPALFLKAPSAVVGPRAPVVLPPESQRVEQEGEIAVVLRERLRRASPKEAREAVLGVTCACDVTARDLQRRDLTFARAKSFDTFCPLGPAIWAGADLDDLAVVTRVNGVERQRGHVSEMAWGIAEVLAYTSRMMTLEPGDVVLTGTPAGVGPLADGDLVEVEIPGLGVLANPVEAWRGEE